MKKISRITELLQNISLSMIVLVIIGSGTLQCYGQKNLAQNASFEKLKDGKYPIDWWFCGSFLKSQIGSGAAVSNEDAHSRQSCVMIDGKESAAWISKSVVKVKPGATYRLSAWIKSDGVEGKGAAIQAFHFCEDRHIITTNSQFINTKSQWQKVTVDFSTKSNINNLQLRLQCDGVGKVYFDDIILLQTSKKTKGSQENLNVNARSMSNSALKKPLKPGSLLIDSGVYPNSFAASAAWGPEETAGNTALPAEAAIVGGVACVRLPCEFQDSGTTRAYWEKPVKLDLSDYDHFVLRFKAQDWTSVRMLSMWFKTSDNQWYGKLAIANIKSNDWYEIVVPKSAFGDTYGPKPGWGDIRGIRIAVWQGHPGKTSFAISDFRAEKSPIPENLFPNSSFEICTTEKLPDYWGSGQWGVITPQWVANIADWRKRWGVDEGVSHSGNRSLRIIGSSQNGDLKAVAAWTCLDNKPHTLSAWIKSDQEAMPVTLNIPGAGNSTVRVGKQWKRYSVTTKAPQVNVVSCSISPVAEGTIWIDDVQLEAGNVLSDWHPARIDAAMTGVAVHRVAPELPSITVTPGIDHSQVMIDGHRRFLVNGEPFIPFAYMPWGNPSETELYQVALAGYNSIMYCTQGANSLEQIQQVLDDAHKNGLKVILWLHQNVTLDQLRQWVPAFKNHPALIVWYVYDEPAQITPEIQEKYDIARKLDPGHPAMLNYVLYPNDRLGDIASLDYYPIPNSPPLGIGGEAAALERAASKAGKPSWIWLQSCGYGFFCSREPTGPEQECMVYLSLINGIRGLQFFAYVPRSLELWSAMQHLSQEVKQLTPILYSIEQPREATASPSAIHMVVKQYQGNSYLIAVNATDQPVKAMFQFLDVNGEVSVLFENRTVKIREGEILDDFEAYQRHVYLLK